MAYLDHAAMAPARKEVFEAMWPYLDSPANPASRYESGQLAAQAISWATTQIQMSLDASGADVTFTSGGTEANNLAVKGTALGNPRGKRLLICPTDHPSVVESARWLGRIANFQVDLLPVDSYGRVHPEDLSSALTPDTTLVSVALASSEVGTIQPTSALSAITREAMVPMHADCVQAMTQLPVSMNDLGVDLITLAGHKIGVPITSGCLVSHSSLPVEPVIHGGGQQFGRRSGTENTALAVGLAVAVHLSQHEVQERSKELTLKRDRLASQIAQALGEAFLVGDPTDRLPGHLTWCLGQVNGETVLLNLDEHGIEVSSGTACAAGHDEPSGALLACGLSPELAKTMIRLTFGSETSDQDLNRFAEQLTSAVRDLLAG